MKRIVFALLTTGLLTACGQVRPVSSECFGSSGRPTCNFTPLPELHARGGVSV